MDKEIIFLVEEAPEGGFTAQALDHSIFTEAASINQLEKMARDALLCHFDSGVEPRFVRLD
jgi:hypothetical protein